MSITDFSKDRLEENFESHLNNITNGQSVEFPDFMDSFMKLEVTHTFAVSDYERIFLNSNESHTGLLSYVYRQNNRLLMPDSKLPTERVKTFGLEQYVFAYLGSHESYYANKYISPAFGVFISIELECLDTSNASRRDLGSPQIIEPAENEFMLPEDVRKIIAFEIVRDYKGDVWSYWGNHNDNNKIKMWERKAEMHFFDKVEPKDVTAIIWPVSPLYSTEGRDYSYIIEQQRDFAIRFPHIKIYEYEWDNDQGADTFLKASYEVSRYFYDYGRYPDNYKVNR